jgi:hypothetical protein
MQLNFWRQKQLVDVRDVGVRILQHHISTFIRNQFSLKFFRLKRYQRDGDIMSVAMRFKE